MKRLVPLAAVLLVVAAAVPMSSPEKVTVTGTLIDTKCYGMNQANVENEHMVPGKDGEMMKMPNCATACAAMGIPAGVLEGGEAGGQVYILVTPSTALADHMAKEVRVTGELAYAGGIIPDKVEVKNDEGAWEEVEINTMM